MLKLRFEPLERRELLAVNPLQGNGDVSAVIGDPGDPLPQEYVEMAAAAPGENGPYHGTAIVEPDGQITYTPDPGYLGYDFFWYTVDDNDGLTSNPALVTMTVIAAAAVGQDDMYDLNEDASLSISAPGVLGNDTGVTPDTVAELTADVSNGVLMLDADGSFIYVPDANWNGQDQFAYVANDPVEGMSEIIISYLNVLPMNDVPIAVDDAYDVDEDNTLVVTTPGSPNGSGILFNDIDIDGDAKTAVHVSGPNFGNLTLNGDGTFTYVPDVNYNGPDQFAYQVDDGGGVLSNIGIVNLTVNAVNDDPVAVTDDYTTDEDVILNVSDITGTLANDTDVDGDTLTATLTSGPAFGTVSFDPNGAFIYTPDTDYNGADAFTYTADDGNGGTAVGAVNITINPVNDAPLGMIDLYTTVEDIPLNVVAPGVLINDTDVDADPLTAVQDAGVNFGTLVLNADGSFLYTPNAGYIGWDAFSYHADDGNGGTSAITNVNIEVTQGNQDPTPLDDDYTVDEDVQLVGNVLDNDTDPDGDPLTVQDHGLAANGVAVVQPDGSFTYDPNPNFFGTDSFSYTVVDGVGGTATATVNITINSVNDAPVATVDTYNTSKNVALSVKTATGVLSNDTDVEGDDLSAILGFGPSSGTLYMNDQGAFIYIPNTDYVGQDQFTYEANDGTVGDETTVTINISTSDAPIARGNLYVHDVDAGGPVYSIPYSVGVLSNDYLSVPGDALGSLTVVTPLIQDVQNGVLVILDDGSFDYTPTAGFEGADTFVYRATDGTLETGDATVTIVVRNNPLPSPSPPEGGGTANPLLGLPEGGATLADVLGDGTEDWLDGQLESEYDYWSDAEFMAAFNAWADADAETQKRKKEHQAAFDAWLASVSN